jgi:hypothetical protein
MMKAALEQYNTTNPPSRYPPFLQDSPPDHVSTFSTSAPTRHAPIDNKKPGDYDVIKMKYLRSLNIASNGPMAIPQREKKEESIASSAPIPIPIASSFHASDSEDESSDTESSLNLSESELSPALFAEREPKEPKKQKDPKKPKIKKFVPPHELNHTSTSGSSLVNHSLPTNYRVKNRNKGI